MIVLIGCMIGGIALAASGTQLVDLKTPLQETMSDYNSDDTVTKAWDDIQKEYQCCGVEGASDWITYGPFDQGDNQKVPDSCCEGVENEQNCLQGIGQQGTELVGCYTKFEDIIKQNESLIYSIVSITLIALVSESACTVGY